MAMLVRLTLLEETPSRGGFPAVLSINSVPREFVGYLPSIPENLQESFNHWQSAYRHSRDVRSASIALEPSLRLTPRDTTTNFSHSDCYYRLKRDLNEWLNSGDIEWQPIRDNLIAHKPRNHSDEIRVIVETSDMRLRHLPWQEWNLLKEHYPQAEVALNANDQINPSENPPRKRRKVRILLVEGCNSGIDTRCDVEIIENLKKKGAEVTHLEQPDPRKLQNELWQNQGYDIFIFTGHSISRNDGQIGCIELNQNDTLSIEDFERALSRARNNGLQLAIFNSCDGLGLANQLRLPQSIVMREPVPDPVAQDFLQDFFNEFTAGNSLFASVREAREGLEHWNIQYPGAQWLPTICIGSGVKPFSWPKKSWIAHILVNAVVGGAIAILAMIMVSQNRPSTTAKEKTPDRPSTFAEVKTPPGNWLYSSSPAWKTIGSTIESEIEEVHFNFNLVYNEHENQIEKLLDGQLAFVLSERQINDDDLESADKRGVKLEQVAIATPSRLGCSQLFVVFRKDGQLDEEAGVAYSKLLLTDDGQKLIKSCVKLHSKA